MCAKSAAYTANPSLFVEREHERCSAHADTIYLRFCRPVEMETQLQYKFVQAAWATYLVGVRTRRCALRVLIRRAVAYVA